MGISDWSYTADESLGVLRCSWYTANEAETKLVLVISAIHTVSKFDSPLYQGHSKRQSPLAHFPP